MDNSLYDMLNPDNAMKTAKTAMLISGGLGLGVATAGSILGYKLYKDHRELQKLRKQALKKYLTNQELSPEEIETFKTSIK